MAILTIPDPLFIIPFRQMRIAKPLLLITTPIGVAFGLYEAWRLAGGLVFLMAAMLAVVSIAIGSVVLTIRKERRGAGGTAEGDNE